MNKMYLIGSYNKAALKVNESAKKEYERLRSEGLFKSQSHLAVTETSITVTLLNTRSLNYMSRILQWMIACWIMIYYV